MSANHHEIEQRLGAEREKLRANSRLKSSKGFVPTINSRFLELASPTGKQIVILLLNGINLRRTCGLLGPKLIPGEIRESDLDMNMGAAEYGKGSWAWTWPR